MPRLAPALDSHRTHALPSATARTGSTFALPPVSILVSFGASLVFPSRNATAIRQRSSCSTGKATTQPSSRPATAGGCRPVTPFGSNEQTSFRVPPSNRNTEIRLRGIGRSSSAIHSVPPSSHARAGKSSTHSGHSVWSALSVTTRSSIHTRPTLPLHPAGAMISIHPRVTVSTR